jgi:hypothetical protein
MPCHSCAKLKSFKHIQLVCAAVPGNAAYIVSIIVVNIKNQYSHLGEHESS